MKKGSIKQIDKKGIDKFRNLNEIDIKDLNLNEDKDDKNEHLKNHYLKRITNHYNLSSLKYDESFQNLVIYLINKEKKEDIDKQILVNYLLYLDELVEMLKAGAEDLVEIINEIAENFTTYSMSSNQLVFRQGEIGDKFYLIIRGSVDALIAEESKENLSEEEYFAYLVKLKKNHEFDLLRRCLHSNHNTYPIKDLEFEIWLKDKKEFNKNPPKNMNSISLQFYIDRCAQSNETVVVNIKPEEYIESTKFEIDHSEIVERKAVKVFTYKKILSLSTGQKFGDHALLPHVNHRTASVITTSDTIFATMNKDQFNKCVSEVHEKSKQATVQFFLNSPVFKGLEKNSFQRNYFNFFIHQKCFRGDFIFREGDSSTHIFFLKKGEYEMTITKSLMEINDILKYYEVSIPNEKVEQEKIEENEAFRNFMNEKCFIKIAIINNEDILGLDDIVIQNKYLVNLECISSSGEIFKIEKKRYNVIYANSNLTKQNTKKFLASKIDYLTKRMIMIKEGKFKLFFNAQKIKRETKFMYKIKDEREPENIYFGLQTKKDVLKKTIEKRRQMSKMDKHLPVGNKMRKASSMVNLKTSKEQLQDKIQEKNINIMKIARDNPSEPINFNLETDKVFNSSIFKPPNHSQMEKSDILISVNNNNHEEIKINVPLSEVSSFENHKPNNTMINKSLKHSLNNSKSELNLFQSKLQTIAENPNTTTRLENKRKLNLSGTVSMAHLPLLPIRKRYFYENTSMRSSNLVKEVQSDLEKQEEVRNINKISMNNLEGLSKSLKFKIYTPLQIRKPEKPVIPGYPNGKKVVVNSTFTETLYNLNYKTLIVKVKIKDVSGKNTKL